MYLMDILICVILILSSYVYYRFQNIYSYFKRNGIPYIKPIFFLGNAAEWILFKKALPVIYFELHNLLKPHRFAGVYLGWRKKILIRDVELVKNILIKDFEYFQDRGIKRNTQFDIMSRNLFMMKGEQWKNLRKKLTNTFTSGKMKMMFPLVKECGEKLHSLMADLANTEDLLIKDVCARFTTDVIATCAFGLELNSLQSVDFQLEKIKSRVVDTRFIPVLANMFPFVIKFSKGLQIDTLVQDFFLNLTRKTVEFREQHNITRGDFFDQLISIRNETNSPKSQDEEDPHDLDQFLSQIGEKHDANDNIEMNEELMAAQCFAFFSAGFETSSNTLSFMFMELAKHQQIQNKLRHEITTVLKNNNDQLTYDTLNEMTYLDMVIAETLRKYPTLANLIRECTETYHVPESTTILTKGTSIVISVLGIHHDVKYYEKPDEFYPEHFTKEAKSKRPFCAYLPFGEGPRICIGKRFSYMQMKVAAVQLLKDFTYSLSPKIKLPAEFSHGTILNNMKGGIRLRCQKL